MCKIVAIWWSVIELPEDEILIKFEWLWAKIVSEMSPPINPLFFSLKLSDIPVITERYDRFLNRMCTLKSTTKNTYIMWPYWTVESSNKKKCNPADIWRTKKSSLRQNDVATSFWRHNDIIFSWDQAALWTFLSVRLPVRLSHPFHYVPIIVSSWIFSGVITNGRSDVHAKSQGQRSKVKVTEVKTQFSRFRTLTPVSSHIWLQNDA